LSQIEWPDFGDPFAILQLFVEVVEYEEIPVVLQLLRELVVADVLVLHFEVASVPAAAPEQESEYKQDEEGQRENDELHLGRVVCRVAADAARNDGEQYGPRKQQNVENKQGD